MTVYTFPDDKSYQFGFNLCDGKLYGHVYTEKIKEKSSVENAFNKSQGDKLKGFFYHAH